MKILVTGARGQLGYDICRVLAARGVPHRGIDIEELDLTNGQAVQVYLNEYRPDALIHCASFTAVDKAEDDAARCYAINADATRSLAKCCADLGAKMLYISTDYVFAGDGTQPHTEDEPAQPLSVYGKSKLMGEEYVRELLPAHFIVRISWLFGINGSNFVRTMLRLSQTKSEISVVNDQIGSPTYSYDLAHLLCDIILTDRYGTYHASNEGFCSWAEFAAEIMRVSGSDTEIRPIPSDEYPTRATRPHNSRLDKSRLKEAGFTPLPHWKDALLRYLNELSSLQ